MADETKAMRPRKVLIGIGYHLPEGRKGFMHSANKFPVFFYLRKKRFPDVLGEFMFDSNGQYPICEELDEDVSSLTLSGILVSSISSRYYQFHPAVRLSYERLAQEISPEQARDLAQIAREFGQANIFNLR